MLKLKHQQKHDILNYQNSIILIKFMQEIKWLPLRLNIIPLIDRQTHSVLSIFLALRKEIAEGDILAVQKLSDLKANIQQRLIDIDKFYVDKSKDLRTRAILAKMVNSHHQFQKINQSFHSQSSNQLVLSTPKNSQIMNNNSRFKKSNSPINSQRKSVTPKKNAYSRNDVKPESAKNSYFFEKIGQKTAYTKQEEPKEQMRLSDLKKIGNKSKSPIQFNKKQEEYMVKKGSSRKIQQGINRPGGMPKKSQQVIQLQKEKVEHVQRLNKSEYDIKKSFKDLSQLVFTIKMTKEQYNDFMKLKRKNNHA